MVLALIAIVAVAVVAGFGAVGRCWLNNRRNKARRHRRDVSMTVVDRQAVIPGIPALLWGLIKGLASIQREETILPEVPPPAYVKDAPPKHVGEQDMV